MQVDAELTEDDLVALGTYVHFDSPDAGRARARLFWILTALFLFWILVAVWGWSGLRMRRRPAGGLRFVAFVAGSAFAAMNGRRLTRLRRASVKSRVARQIGLHLASGRSLGVLGPRRVFFDAERIGESGERHEIVYEWDVVESIATTGTHAFVFLTSATAIVVPERCFTRNGAFDAFVAEMESCLAAIRPDDSSASSVNAGPLPNGRG